MSDSSPEASSGRPLRRLVIFLVVVAVLAGAAIYGYRALEPEAVVESVVSGKAIDARAGSVTVTEDYSMDVKNELAGRILQKDFNLRPGDIVKEGEVLAQLDAGDLKLQLDKAQIDYDAMQKTFATDQSIPLKLQAAKQDLANYETLNKQGRLSDVDLRNDELAYKLQEQGAALDQIQRDQKLATGKNDLNALQRQIDKMTLRAPGDGVVKAVYYHPGDLIGSGTAIATIITQKKVVRAEISDEDIARIKVGQAASVTLIPYGNWIFNGHVSKILPTADPQTQRHVVFIDGLDVTAEKPLVPGITGECTITVDEHNATAVVPRRAVFSFEGDSVYVVSNGIVHRRSIEKGYVWETGVEVLKGVEPGDQVIVEGLENFQDGEHVRTVQIPSDVYHKLK